MLATASRAPSVHNTQPWRLSVSKHAIELYADPARKTHHDPIGRQMLISCGAARFGLRLAVRDLGRVPKVTLFPNPARPALLARVALGPEAPLTELEWRMLAALPHRHMPAPTPDEPPPAATAVLVTIGDLRIDWLRAGQALHRVLAHVATAWVFASLNSEPLES